MWEICLLCCVFNVLCINLIKCLIIIFFVEKYWCKNDVLGCVLLCWIYVFICRINDFLYNKIVLKFIFKFLLIKIGYFFDSMKLSIFVMVYLYCWISCLVLFKLMICCGNVVLVSGWLNFFNLVNNVDIFVILN